jgi:parvulin-like peptidyl-prolyl isomerase
MPNRLIALAALLAAASLCPISAAAQAAPPVTNESAPVFAVVNGKPLTAADYDQQAREAFRRKFYHGNPPEAEVQAMLREVGQQMIDNVLLQEEIEKLKIAPDKASVDREIARYEAQYSGSAQWAAQREAVLPRLRAHLEGKSRLDVLEKQVKNVDVSEAELLAYYKANQTLFTEPEKRKLSLILLRVEPSSPQEKWLEATERGKQLLEEIRKGAKFEEVAKKHSAEASAAKGGDMGYLHRGMLSENIEVEIDKLKLGEIGGPTASLEGVALYRLDDRTTTKLRSFEDVKPRARDLMLREKSARAWEDYLKALRNRAQVAISPDFQKLISPAAESNKAAK